MPPVHGEVDYHEAIIASKILNNSLNLWEKNCTSKKSVTLGVTFVTSVIIDNLEIVTFGDKRWHPVWKSVTFQNNSIIGVFWFF